MRYVKLYLGIRCKIKFPLHSCYICLKREFSCICVCVYIDKFKPKPPNYDIGTFLRKVNFFEVKCVDTVTKVGAFKQQLNEVKYDILLNS